jgi:glycosyltransferase involved in cell wall biosynthesis
VAPSASFLNDTLQTFPGLARTLVCIHHGIRDTEFGAGKSPHAAADPYILCVAMHNEKKGLDTLIRAFRTVAAVYDRLTLRLVGDGPLRPMLEALARAHGLSARIEFLGSVSRAEIVRLMKGTNLFVLPSRSEPFGLALLEAAVCRRAIVATDVGGIPEIIRHEVSGLLVPPDNVEALSASLLRLLDRPELRRALGEAAYQTVTSRFSWEIMGEQYESLMSHLVTAERRDAAS